jgi:2,3-bisphosphoglycerate-independent phosphoglycerate mutase
VPVAVCGKGIGCDDIKVFSETEAPKGALGFMKGDELMRLLLKL